MPRMRPINAPVITRTGRLLKDWILLVVATAKLGSVVSRIVNPVFT